MKDGDWYAVMTRARSEGIATVNLQRQHFSVFFPFCREWVRRKRPNSNTYVRREREVAYMPRYIFVMAGPGDFKVIEDTVGVSVIVRSPMTRKPLPISDSIMDRLMAWADETGLVSEEDKTRAGYGFLGKVGDHFEFASESPFAGLLASIASLDGLDAKGHIIAELTLFGSRRKVPVPIANVGKLARTG